jgi:hypothetical protein
VSEKRSVPAGDEMHTNTPAKASAIPALRGVDPRRAFPRSSCTVPFLVSEPETEVPDMRRRCEAKDAEACTHHGFVCTEST